MKLTCKAKYWQAICDVTKMAADEMNIQVTKQGVGFHVSSVGNVSMIKVDIPNTIFEEYECDDDTRIGIYIENLAKTLKRFRGDDTITITWTNESRLGITSDVKSFELSTTHVELKDKKTPQIEHHVDLRCSIQEIRDVIADVELISVDIKCVAKDDVLTITGYDTSSGKYKREIDCIVKGSAEATYNITFLKETISAIAPYITDMRIQYRHKGPIELNWSVDGVLPMTYYLAPIMERDDQ